ncbi:mevalonate kinase [Brachybacterium endophyticum]|uniref:Mevalonate kinase n=1 Tax=Brachybacterium endophyticum TaxID=2182385 RepID=A0A2U2RHF2_9MICO|nr:mevalonate kinase [Brachybacterium endophyticum]
MMQSRQSAEDQGETSMQQVRSTAPGDRTGHGHAHAKSILLGEHAVVYGTPAIAVPLHALDLTVTVHSRADEQIRIRSELYDGSAEEAPQRLHPLVTAVHTALALTSGSPMGLDLEVVSRIPYERGLGSSAAVAAAIARAIADLTGTDLDGEAVHDVVMAAETIAHGRSSGLDGRAVASDAPILFQGGVTTAVPVGGRFVFVLADSGHAGSTAEAVGAVRELRATFPTRVDGLIGRLGAIVEESRSLFASGDRVALGALMDEAQALLVELEVSDATLDRLVEAARAAGALGAKLTGGGRGGCILALAPDVESAADLQHSLRAAGATRTWQTTVETA